MLSLSFPVCKMGIAVLSVYKSWESREEIYLMVSEYVYASVPSVGCAHHAKAGTANTVRGYCATGVQVCPPVKMRAVSAPEFVPAVLTIRPPNCAGESSILVCWSAPG